MDSATGREFAGDDTGDHKVTAVAVARELGIHVEQNGVMIGDEIEQLSDMELQKRVMSVSVFARVTPEHKLRIVRAYKNMEMCGDDRGWCE